MMMFCPVHGSRIDTGGYVPCDCAYCAPDEGCALHVDAGPWEYLVEAPDGFRWTRTSRRRYVCAVLGIPGFDGMDGWRLIGFSGSVAQAERTARKWRGASYGWRETTVVNVTSIPREG